MLPLSGNIKSPFFPAIGEKALPADPYSVLLKSLDVNDLNSLRTTSKEMMCDRQLMDAQQYELLQARSVKSIVFGSYNQTNPPLINMTDRYSLPNYKPGILNALKQSHSEEDILKFITDLKEFGKGLNEVFLLQKTTAEITEKADDHKNYLRKEELIVDTEIGRWKFFSGKVEDHASCIRRSTIIRIKFCMLELTHLEAHTVKESEQYKNYTFERSPLHHMHFQSLECGLSRLKEEEYKVDLNYFNEIHLVENTAALFSHNVPKIQAYLKNRQEDDQKLLCDFLGVVPMKSEGVRNDRGCIIS
jgi:hypothetical protein